VVKLAEEQPLTMGNFFPTPKELLECEAPNKKNPLSMVKKYGAKDWYDWQLKIWGTKWDISDEACLTIENSKTIWYDFDSAWGPPDAFVKNVAKLFPKLTFTLEYSEPGMVFSGDLKVVGENIIAENYKEGEIWPEQMDEEEEEV
jgi:hypothetical protein